MKFKILIVGSGQIGTRYLQGLIPVSYSLDIYVYDKLPQALKLAELRWNEHNGENSIHSLNIITELSSLPNSFEIAIISSTADSRSHLIFEVSKVTTVNYWILEKVLTQNVEDLISIDNLLESSKSVWVNTPMHNWSLYKNLKNFISSDSSMIFYFEDIRGLACNTIHYIDLVARWKNVEIDHIDTSDLYNEWYLSERKGFYDIYGTLKIVFKDNSKLFISSKEKDRNFRVRILTTNDEWRVSERDGIAENSSGLIVTGKCEFQSILTSPIVESILSGNGCSLPFLNESIQQHYPLLNTLLEHWNKYMPEKLKSLPIT